MGNDSKNIFARTRSFIEWLLMPEILDSMPPEKSPGPPVRETSFLRRLFAYEALSTDKSGPAINQKRRGFFQYIFSYEPLEKKKEAKSQPPKTFFVGRLFSRDHLSKDDPIDTAMAGKHGLFNDLFAFESLEESGKPQPQPPRTSFVRWFFSREHLPQNHPPDKVSPKGKGFFEHLISLEPLEKEGMPESKIPKPSFLRTILSRESLANETKNDKND